LYRECFYWKIRTPHCGKPIGNRTDRRKITLFIY
jgi:hypothetical protein